MSIQREDLEDVVSDKVSAPTRSRGKRVDLDAALNDQLEAAINHFGHYNSAKNAPELTNATKHNWKRITTQVDNYARIALCFGVRQGSFVREQLLVNHVDPDDSEENQNGVIKSALQSAGVMIKDTVSMKEYRDALHAVTQDGNYRLAAQAGTGLVASKVASKTVGHLGGIGAVALVTVFTGGLGTVPALLIYTGVSWGIGYVASEGGKVLTAETWENLCEAYKSEKVAERMKQPTLTADERRQMRINRYLNGISYSL